MTIPSMSSRFEVLLEVWLNMKAHVGCTSVDEHGLLSAYATITRPSLLVCLDAINVASANNHIHSSERTRMLLYVQAS